MYFTCGSLLVVVSDGLRQRAMSSAESSSCDEQTLALRNIAQRRLGGTGEGYGAPNALDDFYAITQTQNPLTEENGFRSMELHNSEMGIGLDSV